MSVPHITSGAAVVIVPCMCLRAMCVTRAVRGLEAVLPHQPSHPFLRGADPFDPQLRPRFPVPFAMKRCSSRTLGGCGRPHASGAAPTGPRRREARDRVACRRTSDAGPRPRHAAGCTPYARRAEIDWAPLIARSPPSQTIERPPGGPPSRRAARSPSSSPTLACSRWCASSRAPARGSSPRLTRGQELVTPLRGPLAVIRNSRDTDSRSLGAAGGVPSRVRRAENRPLLHARRRSSRPPGALRRRRFLTLCSSRHSLCENSLAIKCEKTLGADCHHHTRAGALVDSQANRSWSLPRTCVGQGAAPVEHWRILGAPARVSVPRWFGRARRPTSELAGLLAFGRQCLASRSERRRFCPVCSGVNHRVSSGR